MSNYRDSYLKKRQVPVKTEEKENRDFREGGFDYFDYITGSSKQLKRTDLSHLADKADLPLLKKPAVRNASLMETLAFTQEEEEKLFIV